MDRGNRTELDARDNEAFPSFLSLLGERALLSAEEEQALARLAAGGDHQARMTLVEANLRFVIHIAKQYQGLGLPLEDLINEGTLGLMKAVERFDPGQGYRFCSYAYHWIAQSIRRALDTTAHPIRLPVYLCTKLARRRQKGEAAAPEGRESEAMRSRQVRSLDAPLREGEERLADLLADDEGGELDEHLLQEEAREEAAEQVRLLLAYLSPREQEVIRFRFGIDRKQVQTLAEVGRILGISRERARQIHKSAMHKLTAIVANLAYEVVEKQAA